MQFHNIHLKVETMHTLIEKNTGSHVLPTKGLTRRSHLWRTNALLNVEFLFEIPLVCLRTLSTNSSLLKPFIYIQIKIKESNLMNPHTNWYTNRNWTYLLQILLIITENKVYISINSPKPNSSSIICSVNTKLSRLWISDQNYQ